MPDQPNWLELIPQALQILAVAEGDLDRAAVEELLGVSRRQAIRIMETAGGKIQGRAMTISPELLSSYLESKADPRVMRAEAARRARFAEQLARMRAEWIRRPPCFVEVPNSQVPAIENATVDMLPRGIRMDMERHFLAVQGESHQDLLEKLLAVAFALKKFEPAAYGASISESEVA